MSVLIAYCTRYGTTASCAKAVASRIRADVELVDLSAARAPDPAAFDIVLVGGSIYGGKIQGRVVSFCEAAREKLMARQTGVFLCCLYEGAHAMAQLEASFPDWLLARVFTRGLFGGELHRDRLSLLDRLLVLAVSRARRSLSLVDHAAIDAFADAVNARLPPA